VSMSPHHLLLASLVAVTIFSTSNGFDLCPEPNIPNGGTVNSKKAENFFLGEVVCNRGYERIGNPRIRCRKGVWSGALPVCTVFGSCQPIEVPKNGRVIPVRGSRESAYRFGCNIGFHLIGESTSSHCIGQTWSHTTLPVCAKSGCNEVAMVDFSKSGGKALRDLDGALYRFSCSPESPLIGSSVLFCDGQNWNSSTPYCQHGPTEPSIDLLVGGESVVAVREGDSAILTCRAGTGSPTPDVQISVDGEEHPAKNFIDSTMLKVAANITQMVVSCTATNVAGSSTGTITIPVLVAPQNMRVEGPAGLQKNGVNVFKCYVERGNPPPKVFWTVEDEDGKRREEGDTLNLPTKDATKEVMIACHAENSEGELTEWRSVPVHHLPSFVTITMATSGSAADSIMEGSFLSIHCTAAPAFPKPNLVWRIEDPSGNQMRDSIQINHDERGVLASSELTMMANKVGLLTVHCSAVVENLGKIDAQPLHIQVQPTPTTTTATTTLPTTTKKTTTTITTTPEATTAEATTTKATTFKTTTGAPEETSFSSTSTLATKVSKTTEGTTIESTTEKKVSSPVIFGAREGALLSPGEVTVFTCSTEAKSIRWMVGGEERGEGSEEELRANKLVSSWAYTAKPGDSSVVCMAVYQEVESSASISFVVKEEQVVTLRNIEDKTKVGEDALHNNNDADKSVFVGDNQDKLEDEMAEVELTKLEVKKEADADAVHPDADAVDKIAGFAAAPEEQFFDAGEEKLEAVDSKIGRSGRHENKVEVVANARNTTLASNASPIFSTSSFFLLPLLLFNYRLVL